MKYRVRRQRPDDWQRARAVRLAMLADSPVAFCESLEAARRLPDQTWRARAEDRPDAANWALVTEAEPDRWLGMARCEADALANDEGDQIAQRPGHYWLLSVWVEPRHRGGPAALLVEAVEAWVRQRAGTALRLEVHESNARGQSFYRRLGFVATGARRPYPLDPTTQEVEMVKSLR